MILLKVDGMSCDGCVRSVTNAVQRLDSAAEINVSLQDGTVAVTSSQPRAELVAAIEAAGFDVQPQ